MSKLADVGKAENQPVSVGVMEVAEEEIARLQHRLENQARTIRVQAETIRRLERQFDGLSLEDCIDLAYSKHKAQMPSQPPRSPKEPPIAPETANVPGEPKPVHPAPNVTIAEGK